MMKDLRVPNYMARDKENSSIISHNRSTHVALNK